MKKFFTLLALLISLGLTSEIIASNNQIVAKSTGCTSIDGKGVSLIMAQEEVLAIPMILMLQHQVIL